MKRTKLIKCTLSCITLEKRVARGIPLFRVRNYPLDWFLALLVWLLSSSRELYEECIFEEWDLPLLIFKIEFHEDHVWIEEIHIIENLYIDPNPSSYDIPLKSYWVLRSILHGIGKTPYRAFFMTSVLHTCMFLCYENIKQMFDMFFPMGMRVTAVNLPQVTHGNERHCRQLTTGHPAQN